MIRRRLGGHITISTDAGGQATETAADDGGPAKKKQRKDMNGKMHDIEATHEVKYVPMQLKAHLPDGDTVEYEYFRPVLALLPSALEAYGKPLLRQPIPFDFVEKLKAGVALKASDKRTFVLN